jgi:hypothetical protein
MCNGDDIGGGKMNENEEFPGMGPRWACENYGQPGHDYFSCLECRSKCHAWIWREDFA